MPMPAFRRRSKAVRRAVGAGALGHHGATARQYTPLSGLAGHPAFQTGAQRVHTAESTRVSVRSPTLLAQNNDRTVRFPRTLVRC
jgi:hypothetical protein